ncbi:MAG: phage virion morphogenesis protein [Acidobacteria bacterium]|nr:phage virion morphogenesis protein [Acidobacteriota bacterium]
MVVISIRTLGGERFVRGFNRFAEEMKDLREPFGVIAQDYAEIAERNFTAEGSPVKWAPLSPRYARRKARLRPGRPILQFDGTLYASLRGVADGSGPGTVRQIYPRRAELGTIVPHAIYHQKGTRFMPAREPEQLTERDKERWARILHEWVIKGLEWVENTRGRM